MNDVLFFNVPPSRWEEYLPLGNGRLGAMVKAHPCNEVIQLNEEGIWSGGPQNRINPDTIKYLPKIRQLVKEGKVLEAQALGMETMSGTSFNERAYQTACDFKIDFFSKKFAGIAAGWPTQRKADPVCLETYKSELNLSDACSVVTYTDCEGTVFTRRTWISAVDDMLFMHVVSSVPGKINFSGYLDRGMFVDNVCAEDGFIFLEDAHGIPFCVGAGVVVKGGNSETRGYCLTGENCDEALFFVDIQAYKWDKKPIDSKRYEKSIRKNKWKPCCKKNLVEMREHINKLGVLVAAEDAFGWHLNEYKGYWNRFEMNIGGEVLKQVDYPTPDLLKAAAKDNVQLVNTYANFSRYLLISASRVPGELPSTLQGLWNGAIEPPWQSKYTININAQMNYWPVNMTSLSECEIPLFDLLERGYYNGCIAAQKMYGCRGYVLHHNTDYWGDAAPQDTWIPGTYWVLGAAWLATHIWEHYEYTLDFKCLERYYYLIHEACLFFVDYLQPCDLSCEDGKPYLVINPSLSPENSYITKTGETGAFTEGSEMDNMILEHLFKSCIKAAKVLGTKALNKQGRKYSSSDFSDFNYVLNHLKKPEMNSDGSLMEWNTEVKEVEPGHRHISHLYGLYPGHTITVEKTPDLAEACKKTLKKRLENGGGHTGWSQAWIINFRAQLQQGEEALEALVKLLKNSTLPNLLDNHPPFQIDGNFGSLAAIVRMLVQSEFNEDGFVLVKLLPALPSQTEWQCGYLKGVCIKGNYKINFAWKNGIVENYELIPCENAVPLDAIKVCGALRG